MMEIFVAISLAFIFVNMIFCRMLLRGFGHKRRDWLDKSLEAALFTLGALFGVSEAVLVMVIAAYV